MTISYGYDVNSVIVPFDLVRPFAVLFVCVCVRFFFASSTFLFRSVWSRTTAEQPWIGTMLTLEITFICIQFVIFFLHICRACYTKIGLKIGVGQVSVFIPMWNNYNAIVNLRCSLLRTSSEKSFRTQFTIKKNADSIRTAFYSKQENAHIHAFAYDCGSKKHFRHTISSNTIIFVPLLVRMS